MTPSDDRLLSYVVERDVDLALVQLLLTSSEFRAWFVKQLGLGETIETFSGVRHSVTTRTGESDIVFGFETSAGRSVLVLIENKIDAAMQDRQAERYFERGENYVSRNECDDFSVCLVAPTGYISESKRGAFDVAISYEEIVDELKSQDHDGTVFFLKVFEQALAKQIPTDNSDVTAAIRRRLLPKLEHFPEVQVYEDGTTNKLLRLESTHESHPWIVLYNAYVPGGDDGDRTIVRINLTGRKDGTAADRDPLIPVFQDELPLPDGYELMERPMDIVRKDVVRTDFDSHEEYIDAVVNELQTLVEFYHPLLTETVESEDAAYNVGL